MTLEQKPQPSEATLNARQRNFALFLLAAMHKNFNHFIAPHLSPTVDQQLFRDMLDAMIRDIHLHQRKANKRKEL